MKKTLKWICWLLLPPLLWGGCDLLKNDDTPLESVQQLPPITTTGANTFGCLLNGEPWVVCGGFLETSRLSGGYGFQSNMLEIVGKRWCKASKDNIYLSTFADAPGVHEYRYAEYRNREIECQDVLDPYRLLEGADNRLEILRLDKENYIMSGTFQCTLVHAKCGDTIYITEGRFDYKWAN
jgi:hypothetical protein